MSGAALLEGLNEEQLAAVTTEAAPLCILAGAGSGKTRVLTRRIAHRASTGSLDPRRALVLTFTRAAAAELVERLHHLGLRDAPTAGTFHSVAYAQLRRRWKEQRITPPTLLDRKARVVAKLVGKGGRAGAAEAVREIEWAKARVVGPDAYAAAAEREGRSPALGTAAIAEVYRRYEAAKRADRLVDFDDLLWLATQIVERDAEAAAAVRWSFQHLFVDELQDVNPLQLRLLQAWLGARTDLCAVGDPNQSIYTWNGADPGIVERFAEIFPGATTLALTRNHRSTPQVTTLANAVLDAGGLGGVRLVARRDEGDAPSLTGYASAELEAKGVALEVRRLADHGLRWSQQAVLVRTNAQTPIMASALAELGIPVRVRSQTPFLDRPAVKDALASMRRLGFEGALARLEEAAEQRAPEEASDDDADVAELVRLADEYARADATPSLAGFTAWVALHLQHDVPGHGGGAVEVVTFHAAKGLEWPAVHVAGLEDGFVPSARARTAAALDEERRLLYVAVTRAEDVLRLSWAATRTFGTAEAKRRLSPYVVDLQPVLRAQATAAVPADNAVEATRARDLVRAARGERAGSAGAQPDALLTALQEWRARKARAARVAIVAVLDDDALAAIVANHPSTLEALQGVPGVGAVRAASIAADVLPLVHEHSEPSTIPGR